MKIDPSTLGLSTSAKGFEVVSGRTKAYARAIRDTNPRHTTGELAPPVFAVVPVMAPMAEAQRRATALFALHGEHDIVFHRPIVPGMVLDSAATVVGILNRSAGVLIVHKTVTRTSDGEPINEQYWTNIVPRETVDRSVGEPPPDHRISADVRRETSLLEHTYELDREVPRDYADASGDQSPYTLDEAAATALGLPGIIVGGICTMSFASRVVVDGVCRGDSARLKRLAVRFSGLWILRPGQSLTTRLWHSGVRDARVIYAFEATDAEGQLVLRNGLAEVSAR